ncbi:MAG: hypothetical protein A3B07_02465 [Candidatus Yonathbacteria bacterium RIFCSPLOWO2_01_FULL_43_27]|uniref:Phosphoribosyltransferase domain-containing protein n=1 Tax=Candidatus Yonathbacteria bacterium RIFCSPLOWO2_01_FULL_43_27 TaxID=1802726 RepID=A0A1G2SBQ7_9BACT|nr:MAG: hypothetical protein A3B07_02465 [Candidatus Yonathbacteria bacterium RIFCSPLOWO2_01_FULL_43_27]
MYTFKKIVTYILDILFPYECAGCRAHGVLFCNRCLESCPRATSTKHSFIYAVFDYQNPIIKRSLWRFKYENVRAFAEIFARPLYEKILDELCDDIDTHQQEKYLLIPIPLHSSRRRERGYNQSEHLAQGVMSHDNSSIFEFAPEVLIRIRKTKPQARAEKRTSRITNLHEAFTCPDPTRIRGRTIILIDDVTTTGATLLSAKHTLSSAHPRKILACTVAH